MMDYKDDQMKRFALSLTITVILILTACKPTPEHEVVQYRGDNALEQLLTIQNDLDTYEHPTYWEETYPIHDSLDLKIIADVELSDGAVFPVYRIKRASVDAKWITDTLIAIWPNIVEKREQERSYEELTEDWLIIKRGQFDDVDENGEIIWVPWEDEEERLTALQEIMDQTPKESTYLPFSADAISTEETQFTLRRQDGSLLYCYCSAQSCDAEQSSYIICRTERFGNVQSEIMVLEGDAIAGEKAHPLTNVRISQEDAEKTAEEALSRLNKPNMKFAEATKARCVNRYQEVTSEGWMLYYTPAAGSEKACAYSLYVRDGAFQTEEQYAPSWSCETIEFYITENGIESFSYGSPYAIQETINDNVKLLSFSEIQDRIKNLFRFSYAWTGDGRDYGIGSSIYVKRIVLTASITQIANQGNEALYVPTWAVFYNSENEQKLYIPDHIMLLNAIDGSLIGND